MAASIAGYISNGEPRKGAGVFGATSTGTERMVVLVGSSHIRGRVGIPDRFTRRTRLPAFSIVPVSVSWEEAFGTDPSSPRPVRELQLPVSEADWIFYTDPSEYL
mmetsp:Transcript_14672/g.19563  ORF Transcript_14672/g.19563 Transcript_14672/m.19563 type:complete len:105 (-) Transcript_14672:332-646(-)